MSVDGLLPPAWPPPLVASLDEWRQGHLLDVGALAWLAESGTTDAVTGQIVDGEPGELTVLLADHDDSQKYVAVISQTCDVAAAGPGARHPTVQVCPVRRVDGTVTQDKIAQIKRHEVLDLVYLTCPPEDGEWVVDLRLSMPVSKAVLAARTPIAGFANQSDEIEFSQRIGSKFERVALHDELSEGLAGGLRGLLKTRKADTDWWEKVEQVRLLIDGDRLSPKKVQMLVIYDTPLEGREKAVWREWRKTEGKRLGKLSITLAPIRFVAVEDMKAVEYRNSIHIPLPSLGRGVFA